MSLLDFHPANPLRVTNWRAETARYLRESKVRGLSKYLKLDEYVKLAYDFQTSLYKCKDDLERWLLMDKYPALYSAHTIYQRSADQDEQPLRYMIEARILANQPFHEISELTGVSFETIKLYEKLFFNVLDKLNNRDYLMACVIGPSVYAGLNDREYDVLWKLYGLCYGHRVLNSFISTTTSNFIPTSDAEINAALAEDTKAAIQRKAAVIARCYSVNPFSQSELLNIYFRGLELEKEKGGEGQRDFLLQNVQIMLDKLPFKLSDDFNSSTRLLSYDTKDAELRTEELIKITSGSIIEDNEVENLKFPEPDTEPNNNGTK